MRTPSGPSISDHDGLNTDDPVAALVEARILLGVVARLDFEAHRLGNDVLMVDTDRAELDRVHAQ